MGRRSAAFALCLPLSPSLWLCGSVANSIHTVVMNLIRRLTGEDIPAVAALFHKVHLANDAATPKSSLAAISAEFEEIFLHNPWRDEYPHSLVCEDVNGAILGFIGVTPRKMNIRGRPVVAAVSAHLMLDPGGRTELAGMRGQASGARLTPGAGRSWRACGFYNDSSPARRSFP